jgi:hypothetical protein
MQPFVKRKSQQVQSGWLMAEADRPTLQVLLRVQISRPRLRNALRSVQLNVSGLLLNAKTESADELLNLTVDTVRAGRLLHSSQRG